jgi:hypothetical protein
VPEAETAGSYVKLAAGGSLVKGLQEKIRLEAKSGHRQHVNEESKGLGD